MSNLTLQVSTEPDSAVIRCGGTLMGSDTDLLKTQVRSLIPRTKRIVLDLTDLTRMDSLGLGTIVGLYVSAKTSGCQLELINLSPRIRELLSITNLFSLFESCGENNVKIL